MLLELESGDPKSAIREYRAVLALDPSDPAESHYDLARALMAAQRTNEARDEVFCVAGRPRRISNQRNSYCSNWINKLCQSPTQPSATPSSSKACVKRFQQTHTAIAREVRKVIVGQEEVIERC